MGQRRNSQEGVTHIMVSQIITALLVAALDTAWSMCRAGQKAALAQSDIVARFWLGVGNTGEALEAIVDRVSAWCGIDISASMIDRVYGL
ncbi:hypothetical protein BDS110ZK4_56670 [Bradyrhizobium diazoefficiens]|uniref:Uncharacterized protein n=2 Tax=Bradyrhizobium diazoefficiens TaxID=1355477 RepID=A0A809XDD2_9BRAD|nr:hypothetical protein XF1B_86630 [Bradyrhizobium diazoefficiens]BCE52239.1 hypothetical protein XF4B_85880 [Bradyrhizobium diazoefficiens]BCE95732.1 hypothetical protein XF10B_85300 [Bradyrhizobium diazoefficiens]BCF30682.1 hypothetical protein XF14B_86340 [Bradyrhizobium diazoefficiens]